MRDIWMIVGLAATLFVAEAAAQHADPLRWHRQPQQNSAIEDSIASSFIDQARRATEKYKDVDTAVGAGYRLVGPDFPGMGEHWVNIRRIAQRDLDAERPAILTYLRIDGDLVLTGAAYTRPVLKGDPTDLKLPAQWHFHSGSIDEETLLLNPRSAHHATDDQPRLAMLHAWLWVENPDGVFAQDNWALPYLRLGLPVPDVVPPQAGKALFLLSDGVEYYAKLIEVAGDPVPTDQAAVQALLERHRERVLHRKETMRESGAITDEDLEWLVDTWHAIWIEIERRVSPDLWKQIRMLAG